MPFPSSFPRAPRLPLLALAFVALAGAARADAEADAKDLFARGRELRAQGNCAGAVELFKKAVAIYPAGLGSARNLAECEEQLGRFASARRAWLDVKRGLLTVRDAKYAGWDADADAAAARLAPKLARLTIDVELVRPNDEPAPEERGRVEVKVDGEPLATSLLGTSLERDPGAYDVTARAPGGARAEKKVTLAAGESQRVALRLVVPRAPEPESAGRAATRDADGAPSAADDDPRRGRRLAGWITFGVGAASLAAAGVALGIRQSALSDLDGVCAQHTRCPTSLQGTVDRGKTASTLVNVFGAVGLVGVGAGLGLVLTSPAPKTALVVRPSVGALNGLTAEWRTP